jgi:hypothetical protein
MNMMTKGNIPLWWVVNGEIINTGRHLPRYHCDPEAHEGADAQAGDSTDKNLNSAGENQTYSAMNWKPFSHGLEESNRKGHVGEVNEHGKDGRISRGRFARRVL